MFCTTTNTQYIDHRGRVPTPLVCLISFIFMQFFRQKICQIICWRQWRIYEGTPGASPLYNPNFISISCSFLEFWQNSKLAPSEGFLRESWIRPWAPNLFWKSWNRHCRPLATSILPSPITGYVLPTKRLNERNLRQLETNWTEDTIYHHSIVSNWPCRCSEQY